jgi:hypothetical protein
MKEAIRIMLIEGKEWADSLRMSAEYGVDDSMVVVQRTSVCSFGQQFKFKNDES